MKFPDIIGLIASFASLALIAFGIVVGILRNQPDFRDFVLLRPVRRGIGQLTVADIQRMGSQLDRSQLDRIERWIRAVPPWEWIRQPTASGLRSWGYKRAIRSSLKTPLVGALGRDDVRPGEVIADVCARYEYATWGTTAPVLAKIFSRIEHPPQPLLARLLYPNETQRLFQLGSQVSKFLDRFVKCKAIDAERQASPITQPKSFGAFATALTGAIVFADAAQSKTRYAGMALIWHSRAFRGGNQLANGTVGPGSYDDAHPGAEACELWAKLKSGETRARPGDYDLRLLDLRSVTFAEAVTQGYVAFVIETAETCYAATEDGALFGCKHVEPASSDQRSPWSALVTADGFRVHRELTGSRVTLLDAYVAIISSDRKLLLAQRTKAVRHGQDVLSATAGGPIEPQGRWHGGDVDEFGAPDSAKAVTREAREEIGLDVQVSMCAPVCVFMCNIRGRSEEARKRGQLVANVLYIAHVPVDAAKIKDKARSSSDPFLGRFEQEELIECDFGSPAAIAKWSADNATGLDQHGMISCLYACAAEYGYSEAREAFRKAFSQAPWWAISPHNDDAVRLTRDPRSLVEDYDWLPTVGPAEWQQYWDSMIF
jgi:8-oxo-dGTP pyrophosphatase MutT (NUDIX family)